MKLLYSAIDQHVPGTKGGSIHVRAVADGLAALGHEVHVATMVEADTMGEAARADGDRVQGAPQWHDVRTPLGRPHFRLLRTHALRRLARELRPDVVMERYHNFGGEGLIAAGSVRARRVLEVNAPVIDHAGSSKARLDRALLVQPLRRWRDWQCRVSDLIVTPTRAILPAWVPSARVLEVEWGADTDRFRPGATGPLPFAPDDRITVIFIGAFRAWHGVVPLVRAMRQLADRGRRDIRAVLIGDGPERARAEEEARGLDNVQFTGALPHDRLPACLAAADIGAAPFDVDAHPPLSLAFYWSPLKVFEYMASGLPVVAPDLPRLRALIARDEAGVLYDARDSHALAHAIERLADPAMRARLGANARARAVARYSWQAHCAALDAALTRLTATSTSGASRADAASF